MRKLYINISVALLAAMFSMHSAAQLTNIRVTPTQAQAFAGQDLTLNLVWNIKEDGSSTDISSPFLFVINPKDGTQLSGVRSTIGQSGSGPYVLSESIQLLSTDIDSWIAQGLAFVILKRTFQDRLGSTVEDTMRVNLKTGALGDQRGGGQGYFEIQSLRLEFDNGNDLAVTGRSEELRASLVIASKGQGLFEGRWQVAEPGSSGEVPIFRTLSLVRKNIQQGQRVSLRSPRLPTAQVGKFLLRFCAQVDQKSLRDEICSEPSLTALAAYEVQGNENAGVKALRIESPAGAQVNADSMFAWQDLPGAAVYQLQIFELQTQESELPSSELTPESLAPTFITGLVLPNHAASTKLSELVKSKLVKGRTYLWRVTAQDAAGQLIGISHERTFLYR